MSILLGVTGSVAGVYTGKLAEELEQLGHTVRIVFTSGFMVNFFELKRINKTIKIFNDSAETWKKIGDPILHIELRKWADILIIAPLSMNTLAKIANGLCDNLLTEIVRAWDYSKPFIVCPSGNTMMIENEPTQEQISVLKNRGIKVLNQIEKTLACGDTGIGAMCHHQSIVDSLPCWSAPIKHEIFIPTGEHPGAFGAKRKYDIHTGVDIYCEEGKPVYAMEDGTIIEQGWFTGVSVKMPWWNDTRYLVIKGKSGCIVYGEIWEAKSIMDRRTNNIKVGQLLGCVKAVLPPEKKRADIPHHSNAMLHIELYDEKTKWSKSASWVSWEHGQKRDKHLMNPTPYLKSIKGVKHDS